MKKFALLICLVLCFSTSLAQMTEDDLFELGCDIWEDGNIYCLRPSYVNTTMQFTDDVTCFSSVGFSGCGSNCLLLADVGCFTEIKLTKDEIITFKYIKLIGNDSTSYWLNETYNSSQTFGAVILPTLMDPSKCSVIEEDLICSYDGETYELGFSMFSEDEVAIISMGKPPGFDLLGFILRNLVYIILIIIIAFVVLWVFKPELLSGIMPEKKKPIRARPKTTRPKPAQKRAHYRRGKTR